MTATLPLCATCVAVTSSADSEDGQLVPLTMPHSGWLAMSLIDQCGDAAISPDQALTSALMTGQVAARHRIVRLGVRDQTMR